MTYENFHEPASTNVTDKRFHFLFCVPTTQLSGGVKVIFSLTDLLVGAGHGVDLFSYANGPEWCKPRATLLEEKNLSDVDLDRYDFVVVSNAVFIPMVLPLVGDARCVFLTQDYESFHHAVDARFESFLAESPGFKALYELPVPIIATSRPIVRLIEERTGRTSYYMPVGLNKEIFRRQTRVPSVDRKRVLMVGNYLMPYKGMRDGFEALENLNAEIAVDLVLITQEERGRKLFDSYTFAKEIHFCPTEEDIPKILASCDAYCCTSWYEGLGLPALEAFSCGTPVVSTRTIGVDDYAKDGVNLILANPNDPTDLREKLYRVLSDSALADRLIEGGLTTMSQRYNWLESLKCFVTAIRDIDATYGGAGKLDLAKLEQTLIDLEREGSLTPIATYREFHSLCDRLARVAADIATLTPTNEQIHELQSIRDSLKHYVSNERAQYYSAFKAKYDLCLLVLALAVTPDRIHIPRLIHARGGAPTTAHATALTEIRYTEP